MVTDNREVLQSLGVLITDQGFFTACAFIGSLPLPGYGLLTVHPVMDILHFLWSIVLTLGLLGQSYTGRLQLPPSKRCKVKSSHTKCHYSLIVKEMDSSKCPSLSQQETRLGLGDKPATMQNEQPSVLSHLYVKNLEELQKKVHDLETKLYRYVTTSIYVVLSVQMDFFQKINISLVSVRSFVHPHESFLHPE